MYVYMYLNTYKHTHTYKIAVKFRKEERLRNYLSIWKLSIFFSVVKTLEILRLIIDFLPIVPTNSYRTSRHFETEGHVGFPHTVLQRLLEDYTKPKNDMVLL